MNDLVEGCVITGKVQLDGEDIYGDMGSRSICNVIINAHRKRIRLLEYHSHSFSQEIHIHISVNILSIQFNLTSDQLPLRSYCQKNRERIKEHE